MAHLQANNGGNRLPEDEKNPMVFFHLTGFPIGTSLHKALALDIALQSLSGASYACHSPGITTTCLELASERFQWNLVRLSSQPPLLDEELVVMFWPIPGLMLADSEQAISYCCGAKPDCV